MSGFRFEDGVAHIGDRAFPWASKVENEDIASPLHGEGHLWRTRHIWLTFENGWLLSITWGSGSYSANNGFTSGRGEWHEESPTAEVWGWSTIHDRYATEDPLGHLTAAQVLAWIDDVSGWASDYDLSSVSA